MHIEHMHEMIEKLTDCTKTAFEENQTHVGQIPVTDVVDMIKDLNEAEYYATIVKAMKEAKEEEEDEEKAELRKFKEMMRGGEMDDRDLYGRMGYDRWRYRDGRFAPKGRGHRSGYMPPMMDYPYMEEDDIFEGAYPRMGYTGDMGSRGGNYGGRNNGRGENSGRYGYDNRENSRHGRSYDNYRNARRHYTESGDESEKKRMEESMKEHVEDFSDSIKEMWKDAEPQLRQQMKSEMMKIVQQLQ